MNDPMYWDGERLAHLLGRIEKVADIACETSGKFRYVVSRVPALGAGLGCQHG